MGKCPTGKIRHLRAGTTCGHTARAHCSWPSRAGPFMSVKQNWCLGQPDCCTVTASFWNFQSLHDAGLLYITVCPHDACGACGDNNGPSAVMFARHYATCCSLLVAHIPSWCQWHTGWRSACHILPERSGKCEHCVLHGHFFPPIHPHHTL